MKKSRKIGISVFSLILTILMSIPANADIVSSSKVTNTIDSQLQSLLKSASANERFPVDIWLYETTTNESREQEIYSKIGVSKAQILSDTKNVVTSEKIDEYIATERAIYSAETLQQYAIMRLEYSNVEALQNTRKTGTKLFYSQYAPMISTELTSEEIKLLARDSRVESISYSPDVTLVFESNISIPVVGANYTRDTLGYTGSGINIGMIEPAVPNNTLPYFTEDNIEYDTDLSYQVTHPHSNTVAAIMVGKETTIGGVTYEGIVPDAKLFATYYESGNTDDWRERVEWLLSEQVNVINMSAGFKEDVAPTGVYDSQARWLDHIAITHSVHFVKSAGNNSAGITSPGMAYNIITVGAINDKNTNDATLTLSDDELYDQSSFEEYVSTNEEDEEDEEVHPTNKPDLVAPGYAIYTPAYDANNYEGTSFAAPHVTAIIAQLCQRFPSLKVYQDGVKAILTASVSHGTLAYDCGISDSDNYDKFGAGVINAKAAFETASNYRLVCTTFPANGSAGAEKAYTFSVPSGQRVRVSLTWLKYATIPEDTPHASYEPSDYNLADLDLYIIDPDGLWIESSNTYYFNTEIVDFETEKSGTYQMVIINHTPSNRAVYFGLAWWFE